MKIAAVLISIGELPYEAISVRLNNEYYESIGVELRVLKETHVNTKPQWNKSILFDIYDDVDFVIAQDLDIIPCNKRFNIVDFIDLNEINMAVDSTVYGKKQYTTRFPYFRYNAGLTCYPKRYQDDFRKIFNYGHNDPHGWETGDQYYINEYIGENKLFVNEIPQIFNTFYHDNFNYNKSVFCHYTHSMISEEKYNCITNNHPKEL